MFKLGEISFFFDPDRRCISGTIAPLNPSFEASLRRTLLWLTGRTSPERPISPNTTTSAGTGTPVIDDTNAAATAKSAAGSLIRNPPATFR